MKTQSKANSGKAQDNNRTPAKKIEWFQVPLFSDKEMCDKNYSNKGAGHGNDV